MRPDPRALIEAARPLRDGLHILGPPDLVLHSAAHLFQDGDLDGGLRDLVDLDLLLRHFGADPAFWEGLVPRAIQLSLARPLYYALRYCQVLLGCPVPVAVQRAARVARPMLPLRSFMGRSDLPRGHARRLGQPFPRNEPGATASHTDCTGSVCRRGPSSRAISRGRPPAACFRPYSRKPRTT